MQSNFTLSVSLPIHFVDLLSKFFVLFLFAQSALPSYSSCCSAIIFVSHFMQI